MPAPSHISCCPLHIHPLLSLSPTYHILSDFVDSHGTIISQSSWNGNKSSHVSNDLWPWQPHPPSSCWTTCRRILFLLFTPSPCWLYLTSQFASKNGCCHMLVLPIRVGHHIITQSHPFSIAASPPLLHCLHYKRKGDSASVLLATTLNSFWQLVFQSLLHTDCCFHLFNPFIPGPSYPLTHLNLLTTQPLPLTALELLSLLWTILIGPDAVPS